MFSLEELFGQTDDFCEVFEPQWQCALIGTGLHPLDCVIETVDGL